MIREETTVVFYIYIFLCVLEACKCELQHDMNSLSVAEEAQVGIATSKCIEECVFL